MVWEASQKGVPFLGVPGNSLNYRVLKGPGVSKVRRCSWGTLKIPEGKIGEP